ncbi:hypothetical protein P7C70_g3213, partial [Phenoliferia sp. Uapishka_3]
MSTIYHDSFQHARPNLTFAKVSDRLTLSKAYTTDLSHYFRERAALEDAYVKSLHKLATRLHGSASSAVMTSVEALGLDRKDEERQLGAWKGVRDRLEAEATETARVHDIWRKKVLDEVEGPLRFSLTKPDWMRYQQGEGAFGSAVREYDTTLDKINKTKSKGSSKTSKSTTSKLLSAQSHLASLGSSLAASLPTFLTSAQAVDASHAASLTEALVRYGTLESDLGRERMEAGERFLNAVLAVDCESELQVWALRESMRAGGQVASGFEPGNAIITNEFGVSSESSGTAVQHQSDLQISRAASPTYDRQQVPSFSHPSAPIPQTLALPTAASIESSSSKPSKFISAIFKRDRAGSGTGISKYGNLDIPSIKAATGSHNGATDRQSLESRDSEGPEDPDAATRGVPRPEHNGAGLQATLQPNRDVSGKKRESLMPFSAGGSLFRRPSNNRISTLDIPAATPRSDLLETSPPGFGELASLEPPSLAESRVDAEGYSLPPAGYDKQPWEPSALDTNLVDEEQSYAVRVKPPVLAITPTTLAESDGERKAALERVKSALLSSKSSGMSPGSSLLVGSPATAVTRRGTARGRRDVRLTTYNPANGNDTLRFDIVEKQQMHDTPVTSGELVVQSMKLASPSVTMVSAAGERTNSIISTLSPTTPRRYDPFRHATTPGLRASIVETVNVLLQGGEVTRVMVSGEIQLSHKPSDTSAAPPGSIKIHIVNFELFEKAAPNAAYLTPIEGTVGEYVVSPSLASAGETVTVLKYQLHISPGTERDYAPLLINASWKCERSLTRIIVNYSLNTSAKLAATDTSPFEEDSIGLQATMEGVSFDIPISAPVTTFQAKPAAQFSAERGRLSFDIEPLSIMNTANKVLASVSTETAAIPQHIAVRWRVGGRTISTIGVEVVGGENEVEDTLRETLSGKYLVGP